MPLCCMTTGKRRWCFGSTRTVHSLSSKCFALSWNSPIVFQKRDQSSPAMPAIVATGADFINLSKETMLSTSSLLNHCSSAISEAKRGSHDATNNWSNILTFLSRSGRVALLLKITYLV